MTDALSPRGDEERYTPPPRLLDPLVGQGSALTAIAVGGAIGALARYEAGLALPHLPGELPLETFLVNVAGCLLIGALIVTVTEWTRAHPLVRPFLGTGILGGFTTFSTYAVDTEQLLRIGRAATAGAYLMGTLAAAVAATWLGIRLTRAAAALRGKGRR